MAAGGSERQRLLGEGTSLRWSTPRKRSMARTAPPLLSQVAPANLLSHSPADQDLGSLSLLLVFNGTTGHRRTTRRWRHASHRFHEEAGAPISIFATDLGQDRPWYGFQSFGHIRVFLWVPQVKVVFLGIVKVRGSWNDMPLLQTILHLVFKIYDNENYRRAWCRTIEGPYLPAP